MVEGTPLGWGPEKTDEEEDCRDDPANDEDEASCFAPPARGPAPPPLAPGVRSPVELLIRGAEGIEGLCKGAWACVPKSESSIKSLLDDDWREE